MGARGPDPLAPDEVSAWRAAIWKCPSVDGDRRATGQSSEGVSNARLICPRHSTSVEAWAIARVEP